MIFSVDQRHANSLVRKPFSRLKPAETAADYYYFGLLLFFHRGNVWTCSSIVQICFVFPF